MAHPAFSSDEFAQVVLDAAPDAIVVVDEHGLILRANDRATTLFGYAREELVGRPMELLVPNARRGAHSRLRGGYLSSPRLRPMGAGADLSALRQDGSECPVDIMLSPAVMGGRPVVIAAVRDVSELRAAQGALREREARLRAIFESEPECVKILALDGTLLEMNAAGLGMIEAESIDHVRHHCVYPLVVPEHRDAFMALVERVFRGESGSLTFEVVGLRGTRRWLETHATPLRDEKSEVTAFIGITRDVTDSRRTARRLAQLNRTYAVMSDVNKLIVRERDPRAVLQGACRIVVERGGLLMAWVGLEPPAGGGLQIAAQAGASPDTIALLEYMFRNPEQGCVFTARALELGQLSVCNDIQQDPRTRPWRDAALTRGYRSMVSLPLTLAQRLVGTFNLYAAEPGFFDADELRLLDELATDLGFALEVSEREGERHRAESALRASEERFRELAETIEDVFWVTEPASGRMLYVSPAYERIWGRSRQALYDAPNEWFAAVHPDDRNIAAGDGGPTLDGIGADREYRIIRPDGEVRWIRDRVFKVHAESGEVVREVGVARDLTERRRLEDQLRRSQTLEATGQLAAGVAHDFNNILTVILGGCEVTEAALEPDSPARLDVRQMAEAARRGASLTRQLLAFTRQQAISPTVLDLKAHLRGVVGILRRTIPESISLDVVADDNRWPVLMDPAQIDQVVLNLAVNARDAMPDGGAITIRVDDVLLDAAQCAGRVGLPPGDYVRLSVIDTGHGMDADTLARLFEPFFTTKSEDRGTGLGMPSVYGIVTQNRGHIEVASEVGHGTRVDIHLPRADALQSAAAVESARPAAGHGTVLLVEDNELVRRVTRRMLESLGYRVLEASDPVAALAESDRIGEEIDLLLTDVVMPGMDGMTLAESIRARRPHVRTLCMSGYAPGNLFDAGGIVPDGQPYLQKPFELHALATAVRKALGSTPDPSVVA
jgi:PAS domain S-box-containing protein